MPRSRLSFEGEIITTTCGECDGDFSYEFKGRYRPFCKVCLIVRRRRSNLGGYYRKLRSTTKGSGKNTPRHGVMGKVTAKSSNGVSAWNEALPDHSKSLPPVHTYSKLMHASTEGFTRMVNSILAGREFVTG